MTWDYVMTRGHVMSQFHSIYMQVVCLGSPDGHGLTVHISEMGRQGRRDGPLRPLRASHAFQFNCWFGCT